MRLEAHFFGTSDFADAWRTALRLPNALRNLMGEGTLSASMVPVYSEFLVQGRHAEAKRFAGAVLGIVAVVAAAVVLLGEIIASPMVHVFFPRWSQDKQDLTVTLVRILFPMSGILVVSAWAMGVLDSHRRFFVSYVAPVFWNIALISVLVAGGFYWGLGQRKLVVALAWGALIGGGAQLAVQVPFALRRLNGLHPSLGRGVAGVPEAIRNFGPVVVARGVVNVSSFIEIVLAGLLANGAVAVLGYAQTLYVLPISLFGISVAASELPEMSRMRGEDREVLAARVAAALGRVAYFLIPSAIVYLALGDVVIAALFETGEFGLVEDAGDVGRAGSVRVRPASIGVLPSSLLGVLRAARHENAGSDRLRACGSVDRYWGDGHDPAGSIRLLGITSRRRGTRLGHVLRRVAGVRDVASRPGPEDRSARTGRTADRAADARRFARRGARRRATADLAASAIVDRSA